MTTAHRPTWYNAIGGENQGGNRKVSQTAKMCSKDLPGHLKMKMRDMSDYVFDKNIMKENLLKLENNKNDKIKAIENIKNVTNLEYENPFPEDEDDEIGEDFFINKRKRKKGKVKKRNRKETRRNGVNGSVLGKDEDHEEEEEDEEDLDHESETDSENSSSSDDDDDDSDSETDEEEKELLRELENLKREKIEKEKRKKEEEEKLKNKSNNVLTNNPLINLVDSDEENSELNAKKRKWTDDAIFRNTCERESNKKKLTFVNDSVRSTFHKKFLFKYIH